MFCTFSTLFRIFFLKCTKMLKLSHCTPPLPPSVSPKLRGLIYFHSLAFQMNHPMMADSKRAIRPLIPIAISVPNFRSFRGSKNMMHPLGVISPNTLVQVKQFPKILSPLVKRPPFCYHLPKLRNLMIETHLVSI